VAGSPEKSAQLQRPRPTGTKSALGDFRVAGNAEAPSEKFDLVLRQPAVFSARAPAWKSGHPQKVACRFELRGDDCGLLRDRRGASRAGRILRVRVPARNTCAARA
jgi:hypothetical protein